MSPTKFNCLSELNAGSFNWNIKVRIIRNWKGVSNSGDAWKGINILLLDDKVRAINFIFLILHFDFVHVRIEYYIVIICIHLFISRILECMPLFRERSLKNRKQS